MGLRPVLFRVYYFEAHIIDRFTVSPNLSQWKDRCCGGPIPPKGGIE